MPRVGRSERSAAGGGARSGVGGVRGRPGPGARHPARAPPGRRRARHARPDDLPPSTPLTLASGARLGGPAGRRSGGVGGSPTARSPSRGPPPGATALEAHHFWPPGVEGAGEPSLLPARSFLPFSRTNRAEGGFPPCQRERGRTPASITATPQMLPPPTPGVELRLRLSLRWATGGRAKASWQRRRWGAGKRGERVR